MQEICVIVKKNSIGECACYQMNNHSGNEIIPIKVNITL